MIRRAISAQEKVDKVGRERDRLRHHHLAACQSDTLVFINVFTVLVRIFNAVY
jgi:hypothetical protein